VSRGTYVIVTSKPGQFRAELTEGFNAVECFEYIANGRVRARFVIAELAAATRLRLVDETPPEVVNLVPTKFLEKFQTLEGARHELESLASTGQAVLKRVTCA
jgi:hypothetical protein